MENTQRDAVIKKFADLIVKTAIKICNGDTSRMRETQSILLRGMVEATPTLTTHDISEIDRISKKALSL
jgi:hypothetical protein